MNRFTRRLCVAATLLAAGAPAGLLGQPQADPHADARRVFEERVRGYVELHRKLDALVPDVHGSDVPSVIAAHRVELAKRIIQERRSTKRGAIFPDDVEDMLRALVRTVYPGAEMSKLRAIVAEDQVPVGRLRVNTPLPTDVRSLMPPRLLAELPRLPEELEFRFVGRHFVLVDVETNLIVDYIYNLI